MLRGQAGGIIARRNGAICRAVVDGAVWITHLKRRDTATERYFKLPAMRALALAGVEPYVPEFAAPIADYSATDDTYREITYSEDGSVGYLAFDFYNGAMSTEQCDRLFFGPDDAYHQARRRFAYKLGEADAGTTRSGIGARDPGRLDLGGGPDRRRRRSSGSVMKR